MAKMESGFRWIMYNGISCYLYSHENRRQSLKDTEGRNIKAAAITLRIAAAYFTVPERIPYKRVLLYSTTVHFPRKPFLYFDISSLAHARPGAFFK